jgi:hypothetical protein
MNIGLFKFHFAIELGDLPTSRIKRIHTMYLKDSNKLKTINRIAKTRISYANEKIKSRKAKQQVNQLIPIIEPEPPMPIIVPEPPKPTIPPIEKQQVKPIPIIVPEPPKPPIEKTVPIIVPEPPIDYKKQVEEYEQILADKRRRAYLIHQQQMKEIADDALYEKEIAEEQLYQLRMDKEDALKQLANEKRLEKERKRADDEIAEYKNTLIEEDTKRKIATTQDYHAKLVLIVFGNVDINTVRRKTRQVMIDYHEKIDMRESIPFLLDREQRRYEQEICHLYGQYLKGCRFKFGDFAKTLSLPL